MWLHTYFIQIHPQIPQVRLPIFSQKQCVYTMNSILYSQVNYYDILLTPNQTKGEKNVQPYTTFNCI